MNLKLELAIILSKHTGLTELQVLDLLEIPPNSELGDCMAYMSFSPAEVLYLVMNLPCSSMDQVLLEDII